MTPEQFYTYLESLAAGHVLISHTASEKHFFRGELEEFYMDLRNKVKFPALIAESYELQFEEDRKIRESSFIVAVNYTEAKKWDAIYTAMNLCERIGDELIRKMITDADNGVLCANVTPLTAIPMLNEQHLYAGIRYTFQISTPFETDIDTAMWQ